MTSAVLLHFLIGTLALVISTNADSQQMALQELDDMRRADEFQRLDTNVDKKINYQEFLKADMEYQMRMLKKFLAADKNGDDVIDNEEFSAYKEESADERQYDDEFPPKPHPIPMPNKSKGEEKMSEEETVEQKNDVTRIWPRIIPIGSVSNSPKEATTEEDTKEESEGVPGEEKKSTSAGNTTNVTSQSKDENGQKEEVEVLTVDSDVEEELKKVSKEDEKEEDEDETSAALSAESETESNEETEEEEKVKQPSVDEKETSETPSRSLVMADNETSESVESRLEKLEKEWAQEAFESYDDDEDGSLDKDELEYLIVDYLEMSLKVPVSELMVKFDKDEDGLLNLEEYMALEEDPPSDMLETLYDDEYDSPAEDDSYEEVNGVIVDSSETKNSTETTQSEEEKPERVAYVYAEKK